MSSDLTACTYDSYILKNVHQGRQHKLHILFLLLMQVARDKMDLHSKNGMFF